LRELSSYLVELEAMHGALGEMVTPHGLWAFENGLAGYRAHTAWAADVLEKVRKKAEGK
jgi:hypothetical protein